MTWYRRHVHRMANAGPACKARARLNRVDPAGAAAAQRDDAVLVDIRPAAQRAGTGIIPGAIVVERNYLEWRFDPDGDARLPIADSYDLAGGLNAWLAAGLPTVPEPQ